MNAAGMEESDVTIVGAGPSGAITAQVLAKAGMSVVCLEQGEYPDYTSIKFEEPGFELRKDMGFGFNPNRRKMASDYPINVDDSDINPLMWNGVGGGSVIYAGAWNRFQPSNFKVKTLDGVGADWPLNYDDLAPFYERVELQMAVSGVGGDPAYPHFDPPLPPLPLGAIERRLFGAHKRLGWHIWPGTNAIATVRHAGLQPCVRRGACSAPACFDGAKASVDRTHWPTNIRLGVKLVQRARVIRIETDSRGLATGVTYVDRDTGKTHTQKSKIVVICANGIGTPRILLNSATSRCPTGLANSSDLVGRNLMLHPFTTVTGLFDEVMDSWQGTAAQRAYSLEFAETDAARGFMRGAKLMLMPTGSPLGTINAHPWGTETEWGQEFHKTVYKRFGRSAIWDIIAEDLPFEHNRVTIDPELKDADGIPAPKVSYRYDDGMYKLQKFMQEQAKTSMREAGAYETIAAPPLRETGWHILGTARMGDDPETSVVDGYGRSHDVPNLFVIDGSVMPTSAAVNPTATVAALALRNAEAIVADRRDQKF
ncbi:GMC family oxidoreductase [Rhizobium sp. 2MFCol3.1]|uniref:GMC family oxidoreductase n=1 Tax=Rhizobium sp. 2MFCol3.1 TaxID=1246459 RepID=UPI000374615D|nr:GMC family oxidoreductase [Rhizobium sp. 2MFCol3.1]